MCEILKNTLIRRTYDVLLRGLKAVLSSVNAMPKKNILRNNAIDNYEIKY